MSKYRKKSKAVKMYERAMAKPPFTRAEKALRSITFNYREIPYKRLQFRMVDVLNDECLHELVVNNANHQDKKFLQMAYQIFVMQARELSHD